jgi:CheY-like chemotaxis protein
LALHAAQKALRQHNAELEAAARLREDVDRMLRHDMRGPLGNIIALSELVGQETAQGLPQASQHAQVIADAAYALLSMVHGSFDLLKMERGDYTAQREAFDLHGLLLQVLREMAPVAVQKQVCLVLRPPPADVPRVSGERLLCRSLFNNLLRNALEASPNGAEVTLTLCGLPEAGKVQVALRNAGEVPPTIRERFFDKYVTAGKAQGSGLGTYSARLMADVQGGAILLDCSELGHTQVLVHLPAAPAGVEGANSQPLADGSTPQLPVQQGQSAGTPWPACRRLLLADDDPVIHRYLRQVLPADLAIHSVHDGHAALAALAQGGFDAALLDFQMPGLNGLAVARQWRQTHAGQPDKRPPACRLVALTGHTDAATQRECLSAGFDHVLTKPPALQTLRHLLGLAPPAAPQRIELSRSLQELVPEFLASRHRVMLQLEEGLQAGEAPRVASIAHKLQGSFAMYGFTTASTLAISIEQAAAHDLAQAARLLADLKHHLAQAEIDYV